MQDPITKLGGFWENLWRGASVPARAMFGDDEAQKLLGRTYANPNTSGWGRDILSYGGRLAGHGLNLVGSETGQKILDRMHAVEAMQRQGRGNVAYTGANLATGADKGEFSMKGLWNLLSSGWGNLDQATKMKLMGGLLLGGGGLFGMMGGGQGQGQGSNWGPLAGMAGLALGGWGLYDAYGTLKNQFMTNGKFDQNKAMGYVQNNPVSSEGLRTAWALKNQFGGGGAVPNQQQPPAQQTAQAQQPATPQTAQSAPVVRNPQDADRYAPTPQPPQQPVQPPLAYAGSSH